MSGAISTGAFCRSWTHAYEEDTENRMVLRPSDAEFRPARRPRISIELSPDGEVRYLSPGPDDRRVATTGTWRLDERQLTLHMPGQPDQVLEIESVEPDRFVVRRRS